MWVPGGLVYVLAGLALSARWLNARDRTYAYDDSGYVKNRLGKELAPMERQLRCFIGWRRAQLCCW